MNINRRVEAFVKLGVFINNIGNDKFPNKKVIDKFVLSIEDASVANQWFTIFNIKFAVKELAKSLEKDNLEKWINNYDEIHEYSNKKKIGVISAGNIPLVGFHDILSVLICGHKVIIKLSSKDDKLLKGITELLISIEPEFNDFIEFTSDQIGKIDAIIATGSDNTAKYFEYYFGKYPNIIRKNRNSIAVLNGNEEEEELKHLADDIFLYFGLGCRNVSKIFMPENYDIDKLFKAIYHYKDIINHNKYSNNYTYNNSVYLMNKVSFFENGFFIMTEDTRMASPISVVYFEKYKTISDVNIRLKVDKEKIQCIVSSINEVENAVAFGEAQKPQLWDYADNVDTIKFLLSIK